MKSRIKFQFYFGIMEIIFEFNFKILLKCHLGTSFLLFDILSLYLFRLMEDGGYTLKKQV